MKAVLHPGSRLEMAAADFGDAEQFIAVAHAARNTNVPFMVLKDRVLNERESLADAIHEFKRHFGIMPGQFVRERTRDDSSS